MPHDREPHDREPPHHRQPPHDRAVPAPAAIQIVVGLPSNRAGVGNVRVVDQHGNVLAGPYPAYGKAANNTAAQHGNPNSSPLLPYGDTPNGGYSISGYAQSGDGTSYNSHSYGPNGVIRLNPTSGDALTAKQNGRTGLAIHGGDLDPSNGGLRRTNGCVRVRNDHMADLMARLAILELQGAVPNQCTMIPEVVVVDPSISAGVDNGYSAGDPPPAGPTRPTPHDRQPPHDRAPPHDREPHDREPHDRLIPHARIGSFENRTFGIQLISDDVPISKDPPETPPDEFPPDEEFDYEVILSRIESGLLPQITQHVRSEFEANLEENVHDYVEQYLRENLLSILRRLLGG